MPSIIFWGSEDSDFAGVGYASVDTTAGHFDPYLACGLSVPAPTGSDSLLASFWRCIGQFSASDVWITAKVWTNTSNPIIDYPGNETFLVRFLDANGVPRIVLTHRDDTAGISGPWVVKKVTASGTYTQIGTGSFTLLEPSTLQRLTMRVNYSTTGGIEIKVDDALIFLITGVDVTTDGIIALGGFDLGETSSPSGANTGATVWSAIEVADFDCSSIELAKLTITGAGVTSDWTGASDGSTVDEIVLNDSDGIDSAMANKVELFTQSGTLPSGSWGIVGVGLNARASAAPGGTPQHLDLAIRVSGTNYYSPDLAPSIYLDRTPYLWTTSPATSVAFTPTELSTMQIGAKSVA